MQLNIGMDGDIVTVDVNGDLVASTAEDFKSQIVKLGDKKFHYILVEMSNVGFMDSSGLGACMAAHKMVTEKKGKLVWAKPSDPVGKVFRMTHADKKLAVAATRQEGLKVLQEVMLSGRTK